MTWFLDEIDGPWTGLIAVGLCWAVIGAVVGFFIGLVVTANRR